VMSGGGSATGAYKRPRGEGGMLTRPVKKNQRNGGHGDGWCPF
jgi:hypothetical protein